VRILIDIGHPAHVNYYRNLAIELEKKGHKVFWTVKDIDVAKQLLNYYGFKYTILPRKSDGLIGKVLKQLLYDLIILVICFQKKIDVAIGTSVSIAHVSKITKIKSIVFDDDDDDVQPLVTKYVNQYADILVSPESLKGHRKRDDTVFYPGYHELAYLHPKRFAPVPTVLGELGIRQNEIFFIMRFNAFKAHHDVGIKGLSLEQKLKLVEVIKPYGKIFITTERNIEPELKQYQLRINFEKIHSLMYYATLFIGDSQTMTSEAAVLGVPSLRCNSFAGRIAYLEEEEHKYELTFAFKPENFDSLLMKLEELLKISDLKEEWKKRRAKMLEDKIDVTTFWLWLVENYSLNSKMDEFTSEFWNQFM
jgi:predicted glycosyltransferase